MTAKASMTFSPILGLDNPDGNITAEYIAVPVRDCTNDLEKVPHELIECEVIASNPRDGFNF